MPTGYPADSRKPFCEVCNNAVIAKYCELKRHNWYQKHSDKTEELPAFSLMQHKLLSYKDQTYKVGLKLCSDCLSLSIVPLHKNMQPFERDHQELCVIQKTR